MGTWGHKLYDDDITNDVRESYITILKETSDNESTLKQVLDDYAKYMDCPDDGPLFWFALADTMWDYGRLTEVVKIEDVYIYRYMTNNKNKGGFPPKYTWNMYRNNYKDMKF